MFLPNSPSLGWCDGATDHTVYHHDIQAVTSTNLNRPTHGHLRLLSPDDLCDNVLSLFGVYASEGRGEERARRHKMGPRDYAGIPIPCPYLEVMSSFLRWSVA
jgi:hypothetical protein